MKCKDCKYYCEGSTDYDHFNECELTGDMYFIPFYDKDCPHILNGKPCSKQITGEINEKGETQEEFLERIIQLNINNLLLL